MSDNGSRTYGLDNVQAPTTDSTSSGWNDGPLCRIENSKGQVPRQILRCGDIQVGVQYKEQMLKQMAYSTCDGLVSRVCVKAKLVIFSLARATRVARLIHRQREDVLLGNGVCEETTATVEIRVLLTDMNNRQREERAHSNQACLVGCRGVVGVVVLMESDAEHMERSRRDDLHKSDWGWDSGTGPGSEQERNDEEETTRGRQTCVRGEMQVDCKLRQIDGIPAQPLLMSHF